MDTNKVKPAARRSACDPCRARRVQCLRVQPSTAPCARCTHTGARCVTSAAGHPGRPRKSRLVLDGSTPPRGTTPSPADVSSPGRRHHTSSTTLRDRDSVEVHALAMPAGESAGPDARADGPQAADFWAPTPGDSSVYLQSQSPSPEQSPIAPSEDILVLAEQLRSPPPLQGLPSTDDELGAILHVGRDFGTTLDLVDLDPLLAYHPWTGVVPPPPVPQCTSPASALVRFREDIDQRILAIDTYYSNPVQVVQGCKEGGAGQDPRENAAAVLLTCTQDLINIIQSLTPACQTHKQIEDTFSTEIVLLALSAYLSLMRLFDTLFHTVHQFISQLPPESFKPLTVKSVLRIGGVSAFQDLPLKTYATGIVDAIRGQVRVLERCMGIPAEYCLSEEAATSPPPPAALGMLSRADRARLFRAVVEQEDVKARRGGRSYVESIRVSIRESMRFLDD